MGQGRPALRAVFEGHDGDTARLAEDFVELQRARHRADYDDEFSLSKNRVLGHLVQSGSILRLNIELGESGDPDYLRFLRLGLGASKIAKERA